MTTIAPLFNAVRHYAVRLRAQHDDIRMAQFMHSLPEDLRKDVGWPDFAGGRCSRGR